MRVPSQLVLLTVLGVAYGGHSENGGPSPLQLCCEPHHYFSQEGEACVPSGQTLQTTFHDDRGSPIENHLGIKNVTYLSDCQSYFMPSNEFTLHENGSIFVGSIKENIYEIEPDLHCLIWMKTPEGFSYGSLICFPEENSADPGSLYYVTHRLILPITMSISAFFLLATFIVYCLVPELQDLLGKSFMCGVFCLFLSKVFAVIVKSTSHLLSPAGCIFSGLGMYTFFMQSFFWLNVISVIVFSSLWWRDSCNMGKKLSFILGCLYAFGIPVIMLIGIVLYDFTDMHTGFSHMPRPSFGTGSCWFSTREAKLIYLYAPVGVLVCVNVVLFCLSACKICSIATRSSSSTFHFKNYLKLFLLMGVSWVFEVLSFFLMDPNGFYLIWFIFDMFNGLLGVFIFVVFAFRKKLLRRAKERICGGSYSRERFPDTTIVEDARQCQLTQDINMTTANNTNLMENDL